MKPVTVPTSESVKILIRSSRRSRYMRITVKASGEVIATKPTWAKVSALELFIERKRTWIARTFEKMKRLSQNQPALLLSKPYRAHKEEAVRFIEERVNYWNTYYQFPYRSITVKNHAARWGSCSKKGNLNFNYRLLFLSRDLADYVVVHELCHLRELNHSPRFWSLVARVIPDYKECRKKLRGIQIT